MKKYLLVVLTVLLISTQVQATDFEDIPTDHWAKDAVEGIVENGVTKGYPDGTFRGTRTINRYELSIFLWNMIKSMQAKLESIKRGGGDEKVMEELKSELDNLRAELAILKAPSRKKTKKDNGFKVGGMYYARARYYNLGVDGPRSNKYENRIAFYTSKQLSNTSSMIIKFDSHYANLGAGTDMLSTVTRNIEAKFSTQFDIGFENPIYLDLTTGPGDSDGYSHYDDAIILSTKLGWLGINLEHQYEFFAAGIDFQIKDFGLGHLTFETTQEISNPGAVSVFSDTATKEEDVLFKITTEEFLFTDLTISYEIGQMTTGAYKNKKEGSQSQTIVKVGDTFNIGQTYEMRYTNANQNYRENLFKDLKYSNYIKVEHLYEFKITQKMGNWTASLISEFAPEEASGLFEGPDAKHFFTLSTNIDKSINWFNNYYRANNKNNTREDYLRTGLAVSF